MITIVDYGAGNLKSISNMLRTLGTDSIISCCPNEIQSASKLILSGVGHFDFGMNSLRESGLVDALNKRVLDDKIPILGICLGAQLLTRGSEEGELPGLGWINGDTINFDKSKLGKELKIPHMGWAATEPRRQCGLFCDSGDNLRFYYVHSFHLRCDNTTDELCYATHGYRFVSGVQRENIMGVQFHPEKSHRFGMNLLKNFVHI